MLGAVERRPRDLGHAGVELGEAGSRRARCPPRRRSVATTTPRVGDQERARLDLEVRARGRRAHGSRAARAATCAPTSARSADGSPGMRPTLKPPPRLTAPHVGQLGRQVERHPRAALPHLGVGAGADVAVQPRDLAGRSARRSPSPRPGTRARCRSSTPGPPVLVRLVEPLPSPGFIRTETSRPGATLAERLELVQRAGVEEHARARGARPAAREGICEVSWIAAGAKPARSARSTSKSLEASTCRPSSRNSVRMPRLGLAFIA